ncbi:efflux RND transporter permease subunit [Candidatus Thiodiazotropha sp. CDECU1]|uniref:efflux RND transporter permease subunit n=1 Tax=Candidatus Thiodiazotropha sp. CDECU1 TaxID=3065865 RepID=UPI002931466C|nr:efflux RND transporter permease subunit [Candidatus Thiodiazotropha sp. CDECU1]
MKKVLGGGLASWSIHHPIGVVMITLAFMVLGLMALTRLSVDLLPKVVYPSVAVMALDSGVPAQIMEDQVTRHLEEQLSITEDAIHVGSTTQQGRSQVHLAFKYGADIDQALQDASTRLDRAKRFLPETIDPPIIYKHDPSQLPVAEFVISSTLRDQVALRSWVDYEFSKLFLNLPGVAAVEVGGGLVREINIYADQQRLTGLGMQLSDLIDALQSSNVETAGGMLRTEQGEIGGRTAGRFQSVDDILQLPLRRVGDNDTTSLIRLSEVAQVVDGAEDERMRIRLNGLPGIKLSIQKQPTANSVDVVDHVLARLAELESQVLVPKDIQIHPVDDQARFVRRALNNAIDSVILGAILAMLVVYLFLGSFRRMLIIGCAIPIAILVAFILMSSAGLTLNIMSLGGLALGVGMLVDSTIVMLENIYRHQREKTESQKVTQISSYAASEVNSAIVASTTTNLVAVLPFLFIGGLVGLLFRELIFTISAAILASMIVALTLVPALAGRLSIGLKDRFRQAIDNLMSQLQNGYSRFVTALLRRPVLPVVTFLLLLLFAFLKLVPEKQIFLPQIDEGRITIRLVADRGINLQGMDDLVHRLEEIIRAQPETESIYSQVGGFVFGRSRYESVNRASIKVILKPAQSRKVSSHDWVERVNQEIKKAKLPGLWVGMRVQGVRGIRLNWGDDDLSVRVKGPDLAVLNQIAEELKDKLEEVAGLRSVENSSDDITQEIMVSVDRQRAAYFGIDVDDLGEIVNLALSGNVVTDYLEDDRSINVRVGLLESDIATPADLESIVIFSQTEPSVPIRLGELAKIELSPSYVIIRRDQQQRMAEVSASLGGDLSLQDAISEVRDIVSVMDLPSGYSISYGGSLEVIKKGRDSGVLLLCLALFLVLVVMSVQYESLRNPIIIILCVPFGLIGVGLGLYWTELPISMPVWLGLIMLAGIVVNNAIVMVEYISQKRDAGHDKSAAITQAAQIRLRPILMTTLTTVVGMMPLALALGEGSEMLQPLAVTMISGLSFSTIVTLILIPSVYRLIGR